jgi:hypothetical protein
MTYVADLVAALLSESVGQTLYHISFRGDLQGVWTPRNPDGSDLEKPKDDSEPDLPRISCSPTLRQCFQAIYPNISHLFEVERYPYMDFYAYSPELRAGTRVLTPKDLTAKRMVHDAHMTDEHCILDPVYMRLASKVRIRNTNKKPFLRHRPFGDPKRDERDFAPGEIDIKTIHTY